MFQTFKQMLSKHFSALNNEATALNERQAIVNSVKGFLMGLFRFVIILGVCYVIVGPVLGIIANSFFSNKDAYNPMVYLIPRIRPWSGISWRSRSWNMCPPCSSP